MLLWNRAINLKAFYTPKTVICLKYLPCQEWTMTNGKGIVSCNRNACIKSHGHRALQSQRQSSVWNESRRTTFMAFGIDSISSRIGKHNPPLNCSGRNRIQIKEFETRLFNNFTICLSFLMRLSVADICSFADISLMTGEYNKIILWSD